MKFILASSIALFAMSANAQAPAQPHPCQQIKQACQSAGFVKGQAAQGSGLWADCIDPIIQGKAQPEKAKIKLPAVDASVVAACKAKHPNFGEGKKK